MRSTRDRMRFMTLQIVSVKAHHGREFHTFAMPPEWTPHLGSTFSQALRSKCCLRVFKAASDDLADHCKGHMPIY